MSVRIRKYKRGGWEVDVIVTWPDGTTKRERRKAPVSSKTGARRWGEDRERFLLLRGPTKPKKEVPTLAEFQSRYIQGHAVANRQKPSAIAAKESIFKHHLVPHLGDARLDEIGDEQVQQLKSALAHKANKTVNNVLTVLSTTLKVAVEWKVIDAMPCRIRLLKVTTPEMTFWDFDEYERLVDAAQRVDARVHLIVLLAGEAGVRHGEILSLHQTDVDHQRGFLTVQRNDWRGQIDHPKGGRARRIPLTRRLAAALRANRHLRGTLVLYRDDGKPYTRQTMRLLVIRAERRAGLEAKGAVHKLRHTFCSHLAMRGAPAKAIQELAGHRDLTTTQRYMHLTPAALDSAIRLLETDHTAAALGDIVETGRGEAREVD